VNLFLFLNELSEAPPAPDIYAARNRMERFIYTLQRVQATVTSARPVLRLHRRIHDIELGPEYPVARWLNDGEVRREQQQFLLALETRAQLFPKADESAETLDPADREDCFHDKGSVLAISVARLVDGLPVSFFSDPCWDRPWLPITTSALNADGQIIEEAVLVRHASASAHVDVHAGWLKEFDRITVRDGRDLWDRRKELFPALEFCKEVRGDLAGFRSGDPALRQVVKRLIQMQAFFAGWKGEPIAPDSLPSKCTPESDATMKKYASEHTFTRPSGERVSFSWHVRFTPEPGRIFFEGDPLACRGILGCIARNGLPTVQSST
jgi:hypothetical protein